eukprot:520073-Rhodomonas_salina.1
MQYKIVANRSNVPMRLCGGSHGPAPSWAGKTSKRIVSGTANIGLRYTALFCFSQTGNGEALKGSRQPDVVQIQ